MAPAMIAAPQPADAEAWAAVQALHAALLAGDSATAVLESWCAAHRPAPRPPIVARRVVGVEKPADAWVRAVLEVGPDEPVGYRRVDLACGDKVLSHADNWYLPARLTPAMNQALETSDTPFGKVAAPLDYHRRTLSARLFGKALEADGRPGVPTGEPAAAAEVLEHRAVLSTPDGRPFSLVVESYTGEVLAFR